MKKYIIITEKKQNPTSTTCDQFETICATLEKANTTARNEWESLSQHDKERQHIFVGWFEAEDENDDCWTDIDCDSTCFDSTRA